MNGVPDLTWMTSRHVFSQNERVTEQHLEHAKTVAAQRVKAHAEAQGVRLDDRDILIVATVEASVR